MQHQQCLCGLFLRLLSWVWAIGYLEEIEVSDHLVTARHQHQDGSVRVGVCNSLRDTGLGRKPWPACTCMRMCAHTHQTLEVAAWTLTPHMGVENSLQTDTDHTQTHYILTFRTQTTHVGSHSHAIYTCAEHVLPSMPHILVKHTHKQRYLEHT